jgi:hypothetical protein
MQKAGSASDLGCSAGEATSFQCCRPSQWSQDIRPIFRYVYVMSGVTARFWTLQHRSVVACRPTFLDAKKRSTTLELNYGDGGLHLPFPQQRAAPQLSRQHQSAEYEKLWADIRPSPRLSKDRSASRGRDELDHQPASGHTSLTVSDADPAHGTPQLMEEIESHGYSHRDRETEAAIREVGPQR